MDENVSEENKGIISSTTGVKVTFCEVECVAKSWIIDFFFLSLCRYYREKNVEEFNKTLRAFEVIVDNEYHLQHDLETKRTICCFLSRIMDGKNLDVSYDPNSKVTPLMSALIVWDLLRTAVADVTLHNKVKTLLFVQSVGVCVEMGKEQLATETLQWLETETDLPQRLQRKLSTVLIKKDAYDQLLTSLSYSRLIECIDLFLDAFLEEHPSNFLLKSASKVVQTRQEKSEREESTLTTTSDTFERNEDKVISSELNMRPKKKLFSTSSIHPWKPETVKKSLCVSQKSRLKVSRLSFKGPTEEERLVSLKSRGRRKWTWEEDKNLKTGVRTFGEGKWTKILEKFDFGNRTSVMLKDRWRILKKNEGDF